MDAKRRKISDQNYNGEGSSSDAANIPIWVLRVAPVKADMNEQISGYFERFGTVNSVEIQQENDADTHFGLVEFKTTKAAAEVLSPKRKHRIDNFRVQVKAAKPWHQPDHILNALDDDCLRTILSKLNRSDLKIAANVCVKFNQQAKSILSTKHKKLLFARGSCEESKNLLKTFGSVVYSVDVYTDLFMYADFFAKSEYEIEILTMIARNCTSNLEELTLRDFGFENELPNDIDFVPAFSMLERLSLFNCHVRNQMNTLLSVCVGLKVLHFNECHQYHDDYLTICPNFDKLEELRLQLTNGEIDTNTVTAISQMKHLKVLELCTNNHLTDEQMIELTNGLGAQLERLRLDNSTAENLTTNGLKKMLLLATKLSFLSLKSWKITIDVEDYKAMLETIQKRPEKVKLLLELFGNKDQVQTDETIMAKNRDSFYIDFKEYHFELRNNGNMLCLMPCDQNTSDQNSPVSLEF